jgi:uncharacterized protein (TIGR03437 family)
VQANASGTSGVRRGTIVFQFGDGSTRVVDLLLVVPVFSAPVPGGRNSREAGTCAPTSLQQVFSLLGQQFLTKVSLPTPVQVGVVDDCGVNLDTGSVIASFSNGDSPVPLTPIGGGKWSGTWVPGNTAGAVEVTATAQSADGKLKGIFKVTGNTTTGTAAPIVPFGGVVSSASPASRAPISPGSLITIFGANLSDSAATGTIPAPIQLNQTLVVMSGVALPLLYVSNGQINALVPYSISANTSQQLLVRNNNAQTVPISLPVAAAQPAIFGPGTGSQGFVFVGSALADSSHPATAGDTVTMYCAGLGAVDQVFPAGSGAPSDPLARTVNPVTVSIGGLDARVEFAGLTPNFAGLYQINAVVPSGVAPGNAVEVLIKVAGQTSPGGVTMAVK